MRQVRIGLAASAALFMLVAACGSDDDGSGANGTYGTGLELSDEVLNSAPVGASVEPWYRWNNETCEFEETDEHPDEYAAEIREVIGGESQIGYMHYGNSDPFGVSNSKSVEAMAESADMDLNVYNLRFPSRTEPLTAANNALVQQDAGVIQANLDPSLLPSFYGVLEGEGCVPSIQMYIPVDGHPAMGNNWPDVGTVIGEYIAAQAQERGWTPEGTALVQCIGQDNGPTVNAMFESAREAIAAGGFALPDGNVFELECPEADVQSAFTRTRDWFTANPGFENVAFAAIDSLRMQPMLRAIGEEGMLGEQTILAAGADDESSRRAVRMGDQDMSVAFFGERFGEWLISMLQDLMAGNPVPSFVGTELVPLTVDNIDEHYPEDGE